MQNKTIPMIFNTEMVKALVNGQKTVTRRPLKIPENWSLRDKKLSTITSSHPKKGKWGALIQNLTDPKFPQSDIVVAPCNVGDLIYVRETFAALGHDDYKQVNPNSTTDIHEFRYKASENECLANCLDHEVRGYKWVPSIHMPRHASRLTLKVTDVRIERVQDITPDEAIKEGFNDWTGFAFTWSSIYLDKSLGWDNNPYVWVIEFEVIHRNVDKCSPEGNEYYCQCDNPKCGNWFTVSKIGTNCQECKEGSMQPQDIEPY
ncbi:hypothetical protein [Vibrio parahaemolyticus]|uniref:hypothetical protein n=1 Tax=Vibrio parahaemolyticus TaxID=670 RepID=UPI0022B3C8DE|nr:hypothetical protein [Vibrio parahaemolyticus]MCZ5870256.1 hypothetical protein [Vibrio parahaemolyticus]MCZ5900572.1 hypothetical protein [Vibrio parahaemolyticus]MCZ6308896.1 hypothetical protein [Vibrio parahaemolyticus]